MENTVMAEPYSFELTDALDRAREKSGVEMFEDLSFVGSLERILEEIKTHGRLNERGVREVGEYIDRTLTSRLEIERDLRHYPAIAEQRIERPIIIVGLPRSGTTNLHNLLSCDPALRSPRTWECMFPSPPPGLDMDVDAQRIAEAYAIIERQGFGGGHLKSSLPYGAEKPTECGEILHLSFMSHFMDVKVSLPDWVHWRDHEGDFTPSYQFHRRFLQHLQFGGGETRWLLKAPEHLLPIRTLLGVYPDALIIQTHRDPRSIMASNCSVVASVRRNGSDEVDPVQLGREQLESWSAGIRNMMTARREFPEQTFIDIWLQDFSREPIACVERIYARAGMTLTDETRQRMDSFLNSDGSDGQAMHRYQNSYSLEEFGLGGGEVDAAFAEYIAAYITGRERN